MTDLRKAAEMALDALRYTCDHLPAKTGVEREVDEAITALQVALMQPEDPRITELTKLMAEPGVTGVIFEVHRGPLSKSIREYGECPCPTYVKGDVRIEVKE